MNLKALYLDIVGKRIVDFFRKRGRRPQTVTDEVPDHAAESGPEGLDDDAVLVSRMLTVLNSRQQTVFQLHYFQGLSTGRIAEVLQTSPNNVYSDLFHGRKALRAALDSEKNKLRPSKP